jgi:aminopeptidase-like protein
VTSNAGKRGLYPSISTKDKKNIMNYMEFLQYADGINDLKSIA